MDGGYLVVPVDADALARATDARLVIELGVAEVTVATPATREVAELRRRAEATAAELIADLPRYFAANRAFHESHVGLAGNASLPSRTAAAAWRAFSTARSVRNLT